jgi:hypothetical protein
METEVFWGLLSFRVSLDSELKGFPEYRKIL